MLMISVEELDKEGLYHADFTVFPSHTTLREENNKYAEFKKRNPKQYVVDDDEPFPSTVLKKDIFNKDDYKHIDDYAFNVCFFTFIY